MTPGIGTIDTDLLAIIAKLYTIAANAAVLAPAGSAVDTQFSAILTDLRAFTAGCLTIQADVRTLLAG